MIFHAPQLIYIALGLCALGIDLARHGEPKKGKYNFFTSFAATCIVYALLYWGGFFR